jgi:hypothetical protein
MKNDPIELIPGSGNLFCDFGQAHADVAQLKAILAAEIIKILDEQDLSVRKLMRKPALPLLTFLASETLTLAGLPLTVS